MIKISIFLALLALVAVASAGTFGECSCKFKDGHVQKFQVSDCKASACYIECRQNAGGVQESCVTKNEDAVKSPGPGTCTCGRNTKTQVNSCDSDECFKACDFLVGNGLAGVCKTNARLTAVRPMAATNVAAISCDKCIAKLADDIPADDAAFVCQKILKCKQAPAPTVAPQPTTAAPKAALALNAATISCSACLAKFADLPADDAAKICKAVKCLPVPAAVVAPAVWPAFTNFATSATATGVPFSDCSAAGHLLQVTAVALNPNPPQKGQNVAITISGNLASAVGSATAQLTVLAGAFQVLSQNLQLPGASAGPISQTVNIVVPSFAPSGLYTAKGVITSDGGQQLACVTANFNL